jgi:hypothetical protein
VTEPAEQPSAASWGRVDPDGTVYVRTPEGEVAVGSWLAGSPEEGVAYYSRRYESLAVDITLLAQRITEAHLAPDEAMAKIGKLRAQVDQPQCVGDLAALRTRLDVLVSIVGEQRAQRAAEREQAKVAAREQRTALVAEAEQLAESTQWKATGDRYRAIVEEWKTAPRIDRASEQELWHRLSHARATFDKRRRAHFGELDQRRKEAATVKEGLVGEAEGLADSTDWGPTAAAYRSLMTQWKAAGPAPRTVEDELWTRFRAAQDRFFTARSAALQERDSDQRANLATKLAVVEEAERLVPVTDLRAARSTLRDLQERFAAIGHVPRGDRDAVEGRMRAVEQAVRDAEQRQWQRSNPEARSRAQAAVDQLTAAIDRLSQQLATAQAAGDAKAIEDVHASLTARQEWLVEAQKALEEFSG